MNVWLATATQASKGRKVTFVNELEKQAYYQRRNETARKSHTKTKRRKLNELGIDPDRIKSCISKGDSP
jgi:hypothetical protein